MKRFTFIFALLLATTTMMAEEFTTGDITYKITSNATAEVIGANKGITTIAIPASVTYNGAKYSITRIGEEAFDGCASLTAIEIPNSVKSIGYGAFYNTALYTTPTYWENGVMYVSNCLITADKNLRGEYIIKSGTRVIGDGAFFGCTALSHVSIPNSVTNIGIGAFMQCSSLTYISILEGVDQIESGTFEGCSSLTYLTLPNSITCIGKRAFADCKALIFMNIPNSVTIIKKEAFKGCSALCSINLSQSLTKIEHKVFSGCSSLNTINIPESVVCIEKKAFENCSSLISVILPNNLKEIGSGAFASCSSLLSISLPESVIAIGGAAFYDTQIYNDPSYWEEGVLYIDDCLVAVDKSLNGHYTIKDGTRIIAWGTFDNCDHLTAITIPESVKHIENLVFHQCSNLQTASLSVTTTIGENTFYDCHPNLKISRIQPQNTANNATTNKVGTSGSSQIVSTTHNDLPGGGHLELTKLADGRTMTTMVIPCLICHGRSTCPICLGAKGRWGAAYGGMWYPCMFCGGTGENRCQNCQGKGTITTIVWGDNDSATGIMSDGTTLHSNSSGTVVHGPNGVSVYPAAGSSTSISESSSSSSSSSDDYIEEIVYAPDYTGEKTQVWCEKCKAYRYPHTHVRKRVH